MPETLKDMIKRHEGTGPIKNGRLMPYKDSVGKLTIGFGRCIEDIGISNVEAEFMLDNDIQNATDQLNIELPWSKYLDWPRKSVLINMIFNMGISKVLEFHNTLNAIQEKRWQDAHDSMLKSKWAEQVGSRAIELANIILTGEFPESN